MKKTDKNPMIAGVACVLMILAVPLARAQDIPSARTELAAVEPQLIAVHIPADQQAGAVDVPEEDELVGVKVGEAADSSKITVSLDSVEMADVIRLFTRLSGANIICNTTNLTGNVTANIEDKDWRAALALILKGQGLVLSEDREEKGIYIIEPKPPLEKAPWETETYKLSYLKSAEAATILKSFLGIKEGMTAKTSTSMTKDGEEVRETESAVLEHGRVVSYPAANIVVVSAPRETLREVREVLRQVDVERQQVYIEAKIVEVSGNASSQIGIDWTSLLGGYELSAGPFERSYEKESTRGAKGESSTSGERDAKTSREKWQDSALTHAKNHAKTVTDLYKSTILSAPQFTAVLSALETSDDFAQISNPKLVVANEEMAVIDMSTKDPYVKVESEKDTDGGRTTWNYTTEMETIPTDSSKNTPYIEGAFFSYGIQLKVTPRINNPSNITVNIEPTISYLNSEKGEYYNPIEGKGDANQIQTRYPIIESKRVQSVFSLGNGQTAVIGGLTKTGDMEEVHKVPILGDIPILKYLFSYTEKRKVQTETIIFVTVGIIDSQSHGSAMQLPDGARLVQKRIDGNGKIIDRKVEKAKAEAPKDGVALPAAIKAE